MGVIYTELEKHNREVVRLARFRFWLIFLVAVFVVSNVFFNAYAVYIYLPAIYHNQKKQMDEIQIVRARAVDNFKRLQKLEGKE